MKFPILLPNIFNHPFTYESDIDLKIGDFVEVPFGKSKIIGVVWDNFEKNSNKTFIAIVFKIIPHNTYYFGFTKRYFNEISNF